MDCTVVEGEFSTNFQLQRMSWTECQGTASVPPRKPVGARRIFEPSPRERFIRDPAVLPDGRHLSPSAFLHFPGLLLYQM